MPVEPPLPASHSGGAGGGEEPAMGNHWRLRCVASGLWTLSAALAIGGTARYELMMVLWAVLVALVACIVTGWLVAICAACMAAREERLKLERLAQIMASTAADPGISRLPR